MVALHERPGVKQARVIGTLVLVAKPGGPDTGVGRYVHMLTRKLDAAGVDLQRIPPSLPPIPAFGYTLLRRINLDLAAFLTNYPVWARYPRASLYHLASQNLASLLVLRRPPTSTIVTVHDIIPYMLRDDRELSPYRGWSDRFFDRLAMTGLKRADRLVADSHFTKQSLMTHLQIPRDRIDVVHLGIDHERFRPMVTSSAFRARFGLAPDQRYLIYVGSEDPRKNLRTLLEALAIVRRERDDVHLIKVGRAHFEQERARLCRQADQLGIRDAVRFLDDVSEEDLPRLYSAADLCVMPSLYEGFGFPVLESMACGTPVICSNAASLPELAGDAALLFDPDRDAAKSLAHRILQLLGDQDLQRSLSERGKEWSATFSWDEVASRMQDVYRDVSGPDHRIVGTNGGGSWL